MDATQMINDSILESDEEDNEENESKRGPPLAKLCILKNEHIPETELPLFMGDNVLGRDPNTCNLLLPAPSISKQHATICISVYRRRGCVHTEALVWDLGSMNGIRKGRLKLTPNVRYALSEHDSLVVADIPCQYVSCATDRVSSQEDTKTPVSRNSQVKPRFPDALGEKRGDTSTESKKCANGGTKARVSSSLPGQEDTRKTPVRASCLSFEQTPTQPQGTLVPESDSDSDGERERGGDRRRRALVSVSDSYKSSPTCSTFLSPTNKIVPESEDESPITPSLPTINRPHRHVSLSGEETDADVGRQELKEKKALAIVDDSEEEEGREEERAALAERKSEESEKHVPMKQGSNVSLVREDELSASTSAAFTDAMPEFNMDSDTDMEGEEEGVASAGPVILNTNQQANQPPDAAQFDVGSDTDVDEDDDALVPKLVPSSADNTKPSCVSSVIQPEGISMDSDNDVDDDDDDAAVSDVATKANPVSFQSTQTADCAPQTQLKDFHLDSDTDVDEEEENEHGTNSTCSKIGETPSRLDIKPAAAPHNLFLDSDTDDEGTRAPAISGASVVAAAPESCTTADTGAEEDEEDNSHSPLVIPVVVTTLSVSPDTMSEALQSDSDADTDVDESSVAPAGDRVAPADSGTDVKEKEVDSGEAGEDQIPHLHREDTPGLLVPHLLNCSTPVQLSEGEVEDMETQAFLSPASGPFSRTIAPAQALSTWSDSQEDEEFVVAETQSFILQTRDCQGNLPEDHTTVPTQALGLESSGDDKGEQSSRGGSFRLGLSDSSHLQGPALALSLESTQAFVSVEGGVTLEDIQTYAAISNAHRTPLESDSNPEAAKASGEDEEPARSSVMFEKEGQVDLALEATQAYISEPYCGSEDETAEDERKNTTSAETQPFDFPTSSTLMMAETQPMSAFEEEESSPVSPVLQVKPKQQNETEEREEHREAAPPQKRHLSNALSIAETQPMRTSDSDDSDEEGSIIGPRKRKAKPLQLEEESTQPLTGSELTPGETQPVDIGVDETQPVATSGNEESDVAVETQPVDTGENEESDEEDSIPGPRRRKAKPLPLEEETQTLTNSEVSAVGTQTVVTSEDGGSDDEDSVPGPRKRKAKPLQIQEEETQPTQHSEASTETQALETKTKAGVQPQTGKGRKSEAGTSGLSIKGGRATRATLREEEDQEECPEPPRRQTRGKNKALPATRGRRGKPRPDEDGSEEEEEEVEQAKRARGKKSTRQQKHDKEEEDRLETEINKLEKQQEALERKRIENEERFQAENAERLKLEQERAEKERIERERKHQEEKRELLELLERERKEKEEKERLEREKAEKEERERLERERIIKEQEEKERLETAKREMEERLEREEQERQARLEREAKEREERERLDKEKQEKEAKENQMEEQRVNKEEENKPKVAARSQRASRRTIAAPFPTQDSTPSTNDDVPMRRTRSRSNSSNSVSSERSASSVNSQQSRGRGRGAKRTSEPPQAASRRRTVAAEPPGQHGNSISPPGVLSRSNSSNSLNSEISSCSVTSQSRGRGGRQRGRGRKTEPDFIPPISSQSDQNSALKPTARGRSRKAGESSNEVPHGDNKKKTDSQLASTTRGRQRSNANCSEPADEEDPSNPEDCGCASGASPLPGRNVRARGQKAAKSETVAAPAAPAVSDGERKGRKRELEANTEEDSSSSTKISKGKEKAHVAAAAAAEEEEEEEEANGETKHEIPVQAKRRGRASSAQAKKNAKDSPTEVEVKEDSLVETVGRRGRGRPSAVQKKKKEEQEDGGTSVDQDAHVEASEPQTPTCSLSRKRRAPADSSPLAKTPRSSSASPAASGRSRVASQAYKVLFTGVVDEAGERVLARLGGGLAKGVADMNCLVTDKVRRTVKFLCAVAKGVPIVNTHWLEKSGKAGSFLSTNAFIVKDPEQEKKFNFCLQDCLRVASSQPLLQGYWIHVTKSVKPEPVQMKDIISCSGATFLPKMPSSHKPQTVVISCEEDWPLCGPARSASLPVVTAEFILTGILQQKLDLQAHALPVPTNNLQPAGGRGRSRKKT